MSYVQLSDGGCRVVYALGLWSCFFGVVYVNVLLYMCCSEKALNAWHRRGVKRQETPSINPTMSYCISPVDKSENVFRYGKSVVYKCLLVAHVSVSRTSPMLSQAHLRPCTAPAAAAMKHQQSTPSLCHLGMMHLLCAHGGMHCNTHHKHVLHSGI